MLTIDRTNKKSVREAFGKALVEAGKANDNVVVLDADLSCSTQTAIFAKEFPERFFNVGIAEQDLITTAAGLAAVGKIPFAAAFAVFITGRSYDQIRNTVCYSGLNVKIVGTHGGVTVGEDGATHQALEDIALMANLPGMTVIVPSDRHEINAVVKFAAEFDGPVYIRIPRTNLPDVFDDGYEFNLHKAQILKEGKDVTIVTNGEMLQEVVEAAAELSKSGIDAEIINAPVVKPFDIATVMKSAEKTNLVVTVENHSIRGGIGSIICEQMSASKPVKVIRLGVDDTFGQSGTSDKLLDCYGLSSKKITEKIIEIKNDSIKSSN